MSPLRLIALYTGGKDSTYAIYKAMQMGHVVVRLITVIPESRESYMFHYPNLTFTQLQAEAMGIPQTIEYTRGEKELELEDLRAAVARHASEADGILTGAIASTYQRTRVERIAESLGLEALSPLWGREPIELLREIVKSRFIAIVTAVSAAGLDERWLGRVLDEAAVSELEQLWLRYGVHPCGEGGEMDTFVISCPLFKKSIKIKSYEKEWRGDSGYLHIREAYLE